MLWIQNVHWLCCMAPLYVFCWQSSPDLLLLLYPSSGSESEWCRYTLPGGFLRLPCSVNMSFGHPLHTWEYESVCLWTEMGSCFIVILCIIFFLMRECVYECVSSALTRFSSGMFVLNRVNNEQVWQDQCNTDEHFSEPTVEQQKLTDFGQLFNKYFTWYFNWKFFYRMMHLWASVLCLLEESLTNQCDTDFRSKGEE